MELVNGTSQEQYTVGYPVVAFFFCYSCYIIIILRTQLDVKFGDRDSFVIK